VHECSFPGCGKIAFLQYGSDWRCWMHPVERLIASFPTIVNRFSTTLETCPVCQSSVVNGMDICGKCGCMWRAVSPDVLLDDLVDVVATLKAGMRDFPPDIVHVGPWHMDVVRGGKICGLAVTPGDRTVLIAKPELGRCLVTMPDGLVAVEGGMLLAGGRVSGILSPWLDVVPPIGSYWRDMYAPGVTHVVTGYRLDGTGRIRIRLKNGTEIRFPEMLNRCIRFDRNELPRIGSRWKRHGTGREILITEVNTIGGVQAVTAREICHTGLSSVRFNQTVLDLWRNHELVSDQVMEVKVTEGEEYSLRNGRSVVVVHVDKRAKVITLLDDGLERDVLAEHMDGAVRIERRSTWEMLDDNE
jgi:hypothetical protein